MAAAARPYSGRVVFDHLPKTAGQAVNAWLTSALGTRCVVANLTANHREALRRHGGSHAVLSGHMTFEDGEEMDPLYEYVTLLREPMDRAASWIYYLLGDVPELTSTRPLIDGARRFLDTAGADTTDEFVRTFSNPYVTHFSAIGGGALLHGSRQLEISLEVLRRYAWVGLYEDMGGFLAGFAGLLGIEPPKSLPRVNVSRGREAGATLPAEVLARARILNEWDLRLYEAVAAWVRGPESASPWERRIPPRKSRWSRLDGRERQVINTPGLVLASAGVPSGDEVVRGQLFEFEVVMDVQGGDRDLVFGIDVHDEDNRLAFATNSELLGRGPLRVQAGRHAVRFCIAAEWAAGLYTIGFTAHERGADGDIPLARHPALCHFRVRSDERAPGPGHSPAPTVVTLERVG